MKALIILIAFSCSNSNANAQKVYQSGNYPGQKQKTYEKLTGVLNDKYSNKGLNWFSISTGGEKAIVNVVNSAKFNQAKTDTSIILDSCFLISSRKWKRN